MDTVNRLATLFRFGVNAVFGDEHKNSQFTVQVRRDRLAPDRLGWPRAGGASIPVACFCISSFNLWSMGVRPRNTSACRHAHWLASPPWSSADLLSFEIAMAACQHSQIVAGPVLGCYRRRARDCRLAMVRLAATSCSMGKRLHLATLWIRRCDCRRLALRSNLSPLRSTVVARLATIKRPTTTKGKQQLKLLHT